MKHAKVAKVRSLGLPAAPSASIGHRPRSRRTIALSLGLLGIIAGFAIGVAVGHFEVWPFRILSNLYRGVGSRRAEARFEKNLVGLSPITERQLVRVSTIPKIAERRELLIKYIWPGRNFPLDRLPDSVVVGITDPSFEAAPEIMRITRLTTRMRDNFRSVAYYFEPGNPSGCLMLYQHGHGENFRSGKPVIMRLLSSGCAVLAFSMPLARGEQLPVIRDSILGDLTIRSHNEFALLEAPDFSPIAYFVEPIAAGLNYVLRAKSFSRVGMMGISGGGWTTVVYAALDERIKRSYPVAGSEPIWLMVRRPEGWLDYEQANVGLYRTAEYAELYVMATSAGRHQLQVLNRFDACCYYGKGYRFYAPTVSRVARDVGGSFRIFLDETHREHKLSSVALDSILVDFLGSEGR